jgi:hypothetical protein
MIWYRIVFRDFVGVTLDVAAVQAIDLDRAINIAPALAANLNPAPTAFEIWQAAKCLHLISLISSDTTIASRR